MTRLNLKKHGKEIIVTIGVGSRSSASINVLELLKFISEEAVQEISLYDNLPVVEKIGQDVIPMDERIANLYEAGYSIAQIADKCNIDRQQIRDALDRISNS